MTDAQKPMTDFTRKRQLQDQKERLKKPMTDRFEEKAEKWKVNNLKEIAARVSELPDLMVPTDGPDNRVFSWHVGELSEDQAVTLAKIKVDVGRLFDRLDEQQATITELREKLREVLDGWPTIKRQDKKIGELRALLVIWLQALNWAHINDTSCRCLICLHRVPENVDDKQNPHLIEHDMTPEYKCFVGQTKAALSEQPERKEG